MLFINGKKTIVEMPTVATLEDCEKDKIIIFLQGMVYCWCNANDEKVFIAGAFVGDKNWNWEGTPLQPIFDSYVEQNFETAYQASANAVGKLLKKMLADDARKFDRTKDDVGYERSAEYKWDGKFEQKD